MFKALDPQTEAWGLLLLAGALEVGFTTAMTLENQGHRWAWMMFLVCIVGSFTALQAATKIIPIGIAYAVWTGIGAVGTLFVSAVLFKAPITLPQVGFVALLIVAVAGLKFVSPH